MVYVVNGMQLFRDCLMRRKRRLQKQHRVCPIHHAATSIRRRIDALMPLHSLYSQAVCGSWLRAQDPFLLPCGIWSEHRLPWSRKSAATWCAPGLCIKHLPLTSFFLISSLLSLCLCLSVFMSVSFSCYLSHFSLSHLAAKESHLIHRSLYLVGGSVSTSVVLPLFLSDRHTRTHKRILSFGHNTGYQHPRYSRQCELHSSNV